MTIARQAKKLVRPFPPPHSHLWRDRTRKQSNSLALSSARKKLGTRCRSPSYERFLEGCSSPFMRPAEHLTALCAWCKQMSAWLGKTRRAPSRHSRGARVCCHTTTAMHKLSTPPPFPRRFIFPMPCRHKQNGDPLQRCHRCSQSNGGDRHGLGAVEAHGGRGRRAKQSRL